jgi:hypothetical protein
MSIETFEFNCNRNSSPAYSCDKPNDNSGLYVKLSDYQQLQRRIEELERECNGLKASKVSHTNLSEADLLKGLDAHGAHADELVGA